MNKPAKENEFYTYLWLGADGVPYYVGKGKGRRAFVHHGCVHKPPDSRNIILQLHASEEFAICAERFLIEFYGRRDLGTGCLLNRTDGGEGLAGHVFTAAHRRNLGAAVSRATAGKRKISVSQRAQHAKRMQGVGNPMFGKKREFSAEWRSNIAKGREGLTHSYETKKLMAQSALKTSEERSRRMSALMARIWSERKAKAASAAA